MKIQIEIKNCSECPHFESERVYTGDSFEMGFKWTCKKANRQIGGFVETFDKTPIPKWCPCKIDTESWHKTINKIKKT